MQKLSNRENHIIPLHSRTLFILKNKKLQSKAKNEKQNMCALIDMIIRLTFAGSQSRPASPG